MEYIPKWKYGVRFMNFRPASCLMIVIIPALLLECSTTQAQKTARYRTHTLSVRDLFHGQDGPDALNQTSSNRRRSTIQGHSDSGVTQLGTLPVWVFPSFAHAALEPDFGPHMDITGVAVAESRLHCIPALGGQEYRRLIEVRNQMWGAIIRGFPEIDDWIVGPEPHFSVFVDCQGKQLAVNELVRFFVDTLEELHPVIKRENSDARVIAHFLGDPWIPIVVRGQPVQPSAIRRQIREEITRRGGLTTDYYDRLAEQLDPSLTLDRSLEYIPPVSFSSRTSKSSDSDNEESSQTRSAETSTRTSGWNTKFLEEFPTAATTAAGGFVGVYNHWTNWRVGNTVHLTVDPVIIDPVTMNGQLQIRLPAPEGLRNANDEPDPREHSVGGGVTVDQTMTDGVDVVPDAEFDTSSNLGEKDRWTAVSDFYPVEDNNSMAAHAAVFLRVRDRSWDDRDDQTRFGAFVFGRNMAPGCCNLWCGSLQITGDDVYAESHPAEPPQEGTTKRRLKLINFPVQLPQEETGSTCGQTDSTGGQTEECPRMTGLLWDDSCTLYRVQIIEKKERMVSDSSYRLYWRAQVWMNPGAEDADLVGDSGWYDEWTIRNLYGIEIPQLEGSKLAIGLGPLDSQCAENGLSRLANEFLSDCLNRQNPSNGIDVEQVGTAYWIYPD